MAAAYRLARFNLLAETDEKKDFVGLPVPAAALTLAAFILFCLDVWGELQYGDLLVSMIILFAFLMVSQVQYDTLPDRFTTAESRYKLAILLVCMVAVIFRPRLLLFPVLALYILFGMVREFYRLFTRGVEKVAERKYGRRRDDKGDGRGFD